MVVIIGGSGFVGSRLIESNTSYNVLDKSEVGDMYCDIRVKETLTNKLTKCSASY